MGRRAGRRSANPRDVPQEVVGGDRMAPRRPDKSGGTPAGRRAQSAGSGRQLETSRSKAGGPAKRKGLRDYQRDLTRRRLLKASLDVFEKRGFAAATIDEITNRAGSSRGTFYLYFADKAEALATVAEAATSSLFATESIKEFTYSEVNQWLTRLAEFFSDNRQLFTAWHEGTVVSSYLNGISEQLTRISAEHLLLAAGRERDALSEDDLTRAVVLQAEVEMVLTRWIIYGWEMDGPKAISMVAEHISASLAPPA